MNYGSVLDANYTQFSDDEKLNYGLKIALSRLQTELNRAWYQEPKDFAPKGPESIYKNKLPSYTDIAGYYLIDPFCKVNGVENTSVITNVTVGDILNNSNNASGWGFGDTDGTKNFYNTSSEINVRDNSTNIIDTSQAQQGLSYRMFTRYRYWENGLTGMNSNTDGTAGSSSGGTNSNKTEPENAILSYVGGDLSSTRTWKAYDDNLGKGNSEDQFFTKLTTYSSPIKIIHPDNVDTDDYTDITKAHPFLEIYIQVPTVSTRQGGDSANTSTSGNANGTDNIGFFNPILRQSLGDVEGYKYVIRGWTGDIAKWGDLTIESGATNNTNILYFLNNPGFILCYGIKDIIDGYNLSYKYPPLISFLRYTGETFSDGIISQGDTLPAVEVSNDKDLFINTAENTIHRLKDDGVNKEWIPIGGTTGGTTSDGTTNVTNLNFTGNILKNGEIIDLEHLILRSTFSYLQSIRYSIFQPTSSSDNITVTYNSSSSNVTTWTQIVLNSISSYVDNDGASFLLNSSDGNYNVRYINIEYTFYTSIHPKNTEYNNYTDDKLMELIIVIDNNIILENTREYFYLDISNNYHTYKTTISIDGIPNFDKNKITTISNNIKIYARSLYNDTNKNIILHKEGSDFIQDYFKIQFIGELIPYASEMHNILSYDNKLIDQGLITTTGENYLLLNNSPIEVYNTSHTLPYMTRSVMIEFKPYITLNGVDISDYGFFPKKIFVKCTIEIYDSAGNIEIFDDTSVQARKIVVLPVTLVEGYTSFNVEFYKLFTNTNEYNSTRNITVLIKMQTLNESVKLHINKNNDRRKPILNIVSIGSQQSTWESNDVVNTSKQVFEYVSNFNNGDIIINNNQENTQHKFENVIESVVIPYNSLEIEFDTNGKITNNNFIVQSWYSIPVILSFSVPFRNTVQIQAQTNTVIIRYDIFMTFNENADLGIIHGGNTSCFFEWILAIDDVLIPSSLKREYLDLTEKYCTLESIIKITGDDDIFNNKIQNWDDPKDIKIYIRSLYNDRLLKAHLSQITDKIRLPKIEIISIGDYITPSNGTSSDDRIKHNEEEIDNAIEIIEQLNPKRYIKTEQIYERNHNFILNNNHQPIDELGNVLNINYKTEVGLIAQDIYKIPELKHVVENYDVDSSGALVEYPTIPLKVQYNDIFVYAIKAIKELSQQNKELNNKISLLENKIITLEKK